MAIKAVNKKKQKHNKRKTEKKFVTKKLNWKNFTTEQQQQKKTQDINYMKIIIAVGFVKK